MGIADRKERDRQEMQSLILDAAMKLFLEDGFDDVSIRGIAERIEYSPATIYLYFHDKDEILFALHERAFTKFNEAMGAAVPVRDPLKRLRKAGEAYVAFALENPEHYDLMFIMREPMRKLKFDETWETGIQSYQWLRANVQDCVTAGIFPKRTSVDAATFAIWSFVHGMVSLVIRGRTGMIPKAQLDKVIDGALDFMMKNFGA